MNVVNKKTKKALIIENKPNHKWHTGSARAKLIFRVEETEMITVEIGTRQEKRKSEPHPNQMQDFINELFEQNYENLSEIRIMRILDE